MSKKIFQPKVLAIITMILSSISMCFNIYSSNISDSQKTLSIFVIVWKCLPTIFLISYLAVIVFVKRKNMKVINYLFLTQLLFFTGLSVIGNIYNTIRQFGITMDSIKNIENAISSGTNIGYSAIGSIELSTYKSTILFINVFGIISLLLVTINSLCQITTTYGIALKKKLPYKKIMIVAITTIIILVLATLSLLFVPYSSYNLLNAFMSIISTIGGLSFILFMYQYGNSINERSKNDE